MVKESNENKIDIYYKEWCEMNRYVNDIDKGYSSFLTIFAAIAGGTVTLLSIINEDKLPSYLFYIVPICFLVAFGHLGYQFRITAILRGHLAHLEDKMNELANDKIFIWNSVLVDTHMANNNFANKFQMLPVVLFIICTVYICLKQTYLISGMSWYNIVYWLVITVSSVIIFIPFVRNETIRNETRDNKKVLDMYNKIRQKRKLKNIKNKHK